MKNRSERRFLWLGKIAVSCAPRLVALTVLCTILASPIVRAEEYSEVIDGGTCISYPPYNTANNMFTGYNWQYWLYGFRGTAFCHLTFTSDWSISTLQYVVFTGWSSGVMTARLCWSSYDLTEVCGPSNTIGPSGAADYEANFVLPLDHIPPLAAGAYVRFDFPANAGSAVSLVIPAWRK